MKHEITCQHCGKKEMRNRPLIKWCLEHSDPVKRKPKVLTGKRGRPPGSGTKKGWYSGAPGKNFVGPMPQSDLAPTFVCLYCGVSKPVAQAACYKKHFVTGKSIPYECATCNKKHSGRKTYHNPWTDKHRTEGFLKLLENRKTYVGI